MIGDLAARLLRLERIEAARTLQAHYAEVIDTDQLDRLGEVFAPDAVLTAPGRRFEGIEAITDFYRAVREADPGDRRHFVTNVAVVEADIESVTLHAVFLYTAATGGESVLGWGRYRDTFAVIDRDVRLVAKDIVVEQRGPVEAFWGAALSVKPLSVKP